MDSRDSYTQERTSSRRLAGTVAVAVLIALLVGWLFGRSGSEEDGSPSTVEESVEPGTSDRTEYGAVAAATEFARAMGSPSSDPLEFRQVMSDLAAPGWKQRALELADNVLAFVEERYGKGGSASFHPIRFRVGSYAEDEATVEIWGVILGAGPKLAGTEESWVTATLQLVWLEDEWKVQGQSSRGGPVPEPLRTGGEAAVPSAVESFKEYEHAPIP